MPHKTKEITRKAYKLARKIVKKFCIIYPDPRRRRGIRYPYFNSLLAIAYASILGKSNIQEIYDCINSDESIIKKIFSRIESRPCKNTIREMLLKWDIAALLELSAKFTRKSRIICVDGKTIRGSKNNTGHHVHTLNACDSLGVPLKQINNGDKRNEISNFIPLLKDMDLKQKIVTADAMHTHIKNAKYLIENDANYLFVAKENQRYLLKNIKDIINSSPAISYETVDKLHGRLETRKVTVVQNLHGLLSAFPGIKQVFKLETTRLVLNKKMQTHDTQFCLTSLSAEEASPQFLLHIKRSHWSIENKLHYVLDDAFSEDRCIVRNPSLAFNLSGFRKFAIALLRNTDCVNIKRQLAN